MSTRELLNVMRRESFRAQNMGTEPRIGGVSSYDPKRYAVKVQIQPESAFPEDTRGTGETGWIPIGTHWSGNGWGDFAGPLEGDQVTIGHQEGVPGAGIVTHRLFDKKHVPLVVPAGERWIVHKSLSYIKWLNDKTLRVNAATDSELHLTVGESQATIVMKKDSLDVNVPGTGNMTLNTLTVTCGSVVLTIGNGKITSNVTIYAPAFEVQ